MNSTAPNPREAIKDVRVGEHTLTVDLMDGRTITVPLACPRLLHASPEQRERWEIAGAGVRDPLARDR